VNSWPNYLLPFLPLLALFTGCATNSRPPIPTVPQVDLPRFMGDWHVIAHIPTFIEREARNARDYVWIMARSPEIPETDYNRHVDRLRTWGYDVSQLRRVPQTRPPVMPGLKP
jgi:lipocalin